MKRQPVLQFVMPARVAKRLKMEAGTAGMTVSGYVRAAILALCTSGYTVLDTARYGAAAVRRDKMKEGEDVGRDT